VSEARGSRSVSRGTAGVNGLKSIEPCVGDLEITFAPGRHELDYSWFDLVGNVGVLLMVIAYLLLQLDKLSSSAVSYLLLNAVGAILVIISLTFRFNLSAFFMEAFWVLISLYGLAKPLFSKRAVRLK